jgi:hypothetical protein
MALTQPFAVCFCAGAPGPFSIFNDRRDNFRPRGFLHINKTAPAQSIAAAAASDNGQAHEADDNSFPAAG